VDNAHKYSTAPSRVRLTVTSTASEVTFAVKDEGCGMTAAERERIWEPFERPSQHAHSVHGCGLGLAIVRRIISIAHGRVEVESEQGQGSTFRISLPVCADDEEL
jgi:signal transduction histidine kinase